MSEKQQRLILSFIDFLNQSIDDGTIMEEDREGVDVAVQCIGEAFGVDPTNKEQVDRLSVKPDTLQNVFEVFLMTKDKINSTAQVPPSTPSTAPASASAEDKIAAEEHKREGNESLFNMQYDKAIKAYTEAIKLDPSNPAYYSNRAAAHSSKGDHLTAIVDAEKAIELDPKFTKAYSRLGYARYIIGDYAAAADAYRRGNELEPYNAAMQAGLQNSEAQAAGVAQDTAPPNAASAGGLGGSDDMPRNMGGAGADGMPNFAGIWNDSGMAQMMQQMMTVLGDGMERHMAGSNVANNLANMHFQMDQMNGRHR